MNPTPQDRRTPLMNIDENVLREVEAAMKPFQTLIELAEGEEITGLTHLDDFGVWLHGDGEPVWLVDTITLHTIGRGVAALAKLRKAMEARYRVYENRQNENARLFADAMLSARAGKGE